MNLLDKARQHVVIVSPYNKIKNWHKLAPYLLRLHARNLPVEYYVRKETKPSEGLLEVREAGFSPIEIEGLHCKFYLNEAYGIVTSMNLLVSSDVNALEIGYVTETAQEYEDLVRFLDDNIRNRVAPCPPVAPRSSLPLLTPTLNELDQPVSIAPEEALAEELSLPEALTAGEEETLLACFSRLLGVAPRPHHPTHLQGELSEVLSMLVEVRHFYVLVAYSFPGAIRRKMYQALYAQRAALETQVGYPLSWGRDMLRVKVELSFPILPLVTAWDQNKHRMVADWSPLEREQMGQLAQRATHVLQQAVAAQALMINK
jgi:hypothetical protein